MINLNNYTYIQHHLVDFIPENKYHKKRVNNAWSVSCRFYIQMEKFKKEKRMTTTMKILRGQPYESTKN